LYFLKVGYELSYYFFSVKKMFNKYLNIIIIFLLNLFRLFYEVAQGILNLNHFIKSLRLLVNKIIFSYLLNKFIKISFLEFVDYCYKFDYIYYFYCN
jgi:hypothetical protein